MTISMLIKMMGRNIFPTTFDESIKVEKDLIILKGNIGVELLDDYVSSKGKNSHSKHTLKYKERVK